MKAIVQMEGVIWKYLMLSLGMDGISQLPRDFVLKHTQRIV